MLSGNLMEMGHGKSEQILNLTIRLAIPQYEIQLNRLECRRNQ